MTLLILSVYAINIFGTRQNMIFSLIIQASAHWNVFALLLAQMEFY